MLAFDFMSLKYAIYFILPAILLYALAYVCAPMLLVVARFVVKRDVSQDTAAGLVAWVIVSSSGVALLAYWLTESVWIAFATALLTCFIVGTVAFGRGIKDFTTDGNKRIAPIGLQKGIQLSAMTTLGVLVVAFFVLVVAYYAT